MIVIDLDETMRLMLKSMSNETGRDFSHRTSSVGGVPHVTVYSTSGVEPNCVTEVALDTDSPDEVAEYIGCDGLGYFSFDCRERNGPLRMILFDSEEEKDEWDNDMNR